MIGRVIHQRGNWILTSYGNGREYVLENIAALGSGLLFQGDDANAFREELESLTTGTPSLNHDDALRVIWDEYSGDGQ